MQFIEQLTLIQKAAIGGSIALIMILLLVAARRKRVAAQAPTEVAETQEPKKRKRDKQKEPSLPRRKRRKLAAEAAHAMGVEQAVPSVPAVPEVADVPVITIPEVTIAPVPIRDAPAVEYDAPVMAEAPAMAEAPVDVVPPAPHIIDDPYLHDGEVDENGVFVAQPGWPAPGELASSFDPDAFDPLPEAHGHIEQYADNDTTALELPTLSTTDEVVALEEIEEWADTYDVEEDWAHPAPAATESTWTVPDEGQTITVSAIGGDDDAVWSEPDSEPMWEMPEPAEATPAVELEPSVETPSVAVMEDDAVYEVTEAAWADDSEESWQTATAYEPAAEYDAPQPVEIPAETYELPASYEVHEPVTAVDVTPEYSDIVPEPAAISNWSQSLGGPNSPVVLDLAGLAASGHALELVIEPSADGHGVRLRFGAPGSQDAVEVPVGVETIPQAAVAEVTPPAETVAEEPVVPVSEVDMLAFLAGAAPQLDEPPSEPAATVAAAVEVPSPSLTFDEVAPVVEIPVIADEVEIPAEITVVPEPEVREDVPAIEDLPLPVADAFEQVADIREPDDDPAQILADIRARLAALDARR